jgi:hypothetical protein
MAPEKPAKQMAQILWEASRGEKPELFTGDPGGMSPNKRLMLAVAEWVVKPSNTSRRNVKELLDNLLATGHFCVRTGEKVACETGANGMHWSYNVGSIAVLLKFAHKRGNAELVDKSKAILIDEIGLDRHFVWKEKIYVPGPRVENDPWDGYRDVFYKLATGEKVQKKDSYWNQANSVAVTTLRDLIDEGAWDAEMQERARNAPLPRLYLPICIKQLGDGGWMASIDKTPQSEAAAKLKEGLCDWVRCGDDVGEKGFIYGSKWEKPVPEVQSS